MRFFLIATALVVAGAGCGSTDASLDPADGATYSDFESDDWKYDITVPGPQHRRLDALVGEWDTAVKIWDGPQSKPFESEGHVSRRWILGGRFVEEWIEEFDDSGDVIFQAAGLLGYDRLAGQYEYTNVYGGSTDTYRKVGRFDPTGNVLNLSGTFVHFDSGIVVLNRLEIAIDGPDAHTVTEYTRGEDGREIKEMEIRYQRRK